METCSLCKGSKQIKSDTKFGPPYSVCPNCKGTGEEPSFVYNPLQPEEDEEEE